MVGNTGRTADSCSDPHAARASAAATAEEGGERHLSAISSFSSSSILCMPCRSLNALHPHPFHAHWKRRLRSNSRFELPGKIRRRARKEHTDFSEAECHELHWKLQSLVLDRVEPLLSLVLPMLEGCRSAVSDQSICPCPPSGPCLGSLA